MSIYNSLHINLEISHYIDKKLVKNLNSSMNNAYHIIVDLQNNFYIPIEDMLTNQLQHQIDNELEK